MSPIIKCEQALTNPEIEFQKTLTQSIAYLHFVDGTSFKGHLNLPGDDPRLTAGIWGEAAFTTGMAGYQETLTDPSFLGQHIIFSTAHVGNYPSQKAVNQSEKCHGTAIIARHFSVNDFLQTTTTPLFSGVDSRALVKYLVNTKDAHKSVITAHQAPPLPSEFTQQQLFCNDLARVSHKGLKTWRAGERPIAVINYGIKQSILDNLLALGFPLVTLPYNATAAEVVALHPRLIFLSNGPGDPQTFTNQVHVIKELLTAQIPLRGICLGHQLLGLALGAKTFKLPFGQRGVNHPVMDHVSGLIQITSQNHGYSLHENSFLDISQANPLNKELFIQHRSLFDKSIEGIASTDHFLKSVQFHPESCPGPSDAAIFFSEINNYLKFLSDDNKFANASLAPTNFSKIHTDKLFPFIDLLADKCQFTNNQEHPSKQYKRILLIGSGPIKIGQASEFDYSGTQACKVLQQQGIDVILLNSNPATIMTDPEMAARTYIEPITKETVKNIIQLEKVDAVLSTMGGQTALNLCMELAQENYFAKNNVALLGANIDTIEKTEDRALFAKELATLGYQTGKRFSAQDAPQALQMALKEVGFPLIIRRDFALGGKGAALVHQPEELAELLKSDIHFPVTMEKSLVGYKEIELEVMVDREKNGVIICSIENIDPCGVHTGDSITVAPAQTISDTCYQKLRTITLTVAKHMGVVAGGANVQFAINPVDENDIVVIEMNPRVSRSSALASKATGYPIAKISALLSIGHTLKEILNDITQASPVAFEPTLDYVAIKIPIFPFNKFPSSSQELGPQMRSVGEVLALGGNFNEAFMKALRSLEIGLEIPSLAQLKTTPFKITPEYITERLQTPRQLSLLTVMEGLRLGMSCAEINQLSGVTDWFIYQVSLIIAAEGQLETGFDLFTDSESFRNFKRLGLSDKYLALLTNKSQKEIFEFRHLHKIYPVFKAVDTCSGEFNAETPYFYSTYSNLSEPIPLSLNNRCIVVLGSGPNRIGQGIEFDYSCVKACSRLKEKGIKSIMVNSNPETVSTDYDSSDRLYLAPLYSEDLFDILIQENPEGVISSFSGQTGIKIREHIEKSFRREFFNFNFLGSSLKTLDLAEDRKLFALEVEKTDLAQTHSIEVVGHKNLINAMVEIGFPVIIRPSYVIGGESMYIFNSHDDVEQLPATLLEQLEQRTTTFQVENYLENALEYDVDLIRDQYNNTIFTVCEHIEHAGVHSGDSGMITPPVALTSNHYREMKEISIKLATQLKVIGPINFQYAVKDGRIYCIEANPRGSRTLPFLSKAYNISLPSLATDAMLGEEIANFHREVANFFCVKQSTFPFDRFLQDNIILGPKMRSTGETLGLDYDKDHAMMKSYLGNYPHLKEVGRILISLADYGKSAILPYLKPLSKMGHVFVATAGTYHYIKKQGIPCEYVAKIKEEGQGKTILDVLKLDDIKIVLNTPLNQNSSKTDGELIRNMAIANGVPCFTRIENIQAVIDALVGIHGTAATPVALQDLHRENL